jgi:ATP-dependent DNA helicase RecG
VTASDVALEQLRLLTHDEIVDLLLNRREDQWFDRKSSAISARKLGNLLAGFANAEGGLVAVGLRDGVIEGVNDVLPRVNDWRQAALDFTRPPVRHTFEEVPCLNQRGEQDRIVLVEVESSEHVHVTASGDTYLRVGDENRRLGPLEAQELRYDKGESTYDGTRSPGFELEDLDSNLLERYFARIRATAPAEQVLIARGLAIKEGRLTRPTIAGALVFGTEPERSMPEAFIRLLRYSGPSRETGARANIVADRRLEGPLPAQIDRARRLLRRWLPEAIRLEREGRFERSTLIPEFAWLEAIVNAVTHRSYSIGDDHVRVELFDDLLEVESPGRLPGLVRLDNIRSTRFARNPRIARTLSDLGYTRELGEGVNRMFEEMSRVGLPDPVYSQGPASVKVILLADPLAARILDRLPSGSERFVEYLSRAGRVTTTEAVELMQASRPTVLRYLHDLAERGLIEHTGTSLKDPRGFWRLRRGDAPADG